jgi:uncharacterized membrane protein YdbT with pleckstrin-like domain
LFPAITTEDPGDPEDGETLIMIGAGDVLGPTLIVVEPQTPPAHALIVAVPSAIPNVTPKSLESLETVAIVLLDDVQIADDKV